MDNSNNKNKNKKPLISIVAAISDNYIIAINGKIPWYLPEDFHHFRELTLYSPVILGRKTQETIEEYLKPAGRKYLDLRKNIILTSNKNNSKEDLGVKKVNSFDEALKVVSSNDLVWIIGGSSVYEQAIPLADVLELTFVHKVFTDYRQDKKVFPKINYSEWELVKSIPKENYSFKTFIRKDNKEGLFKERKKNYFSYLKTKNKNINEYLPSEKRMNLNK